MHSAISTMYFKINDIRFENIGNFQLQWNSLTAAVTQHFKAKKAKRSTALPGRSHAVSA